MTASATVINPGPAQSASAADLADLEMTLTLAEWHRCRDSDDRWVVVPHESQRVAA